MTYAEGHISFKSLHLLCHKINIRCFKNNEKWALPRWLRLVATIWKRRASLVQMMWEQRVQAKIDDKIEYKSLPPEISKGRVHLVWSNTFGDFRFLKGQKFLIGVINWLWILTLRCNLEFWGNLMMTFDDFLIWERRCVGDCCYGVGWFFLEISNFDCTHANFLSAAWSRTIMVNSCVAPNLAGDHCLFPGKEVRHFQLPRCRNKNALAPMGLSSALCKGIGPFGVLFDLPC